MNDAVYLADRTRSVVVEIAPGGPAVRHVGAALGDDVALHALLAALDPPLGQARLDEVPDVLVVPEHAAGFPGRPGLLASRADGTTWAPRCTVTEVDAQEHHVRVVAEDAVAGVVVTSTVALRPSGVVVVTAEVRNTGDDDLRVDELTVTVPVWAGMTEALRFFGRWTAEFREERVPWDIGALVVESRRGRSSHETPSLALVGVPGFGHTHGECLGVHVAWSGNHRMLLDVLDDGRRLVQAGELLLPGEIVLAPGERYATPDVLVAWSAEGTNGVSRVLHAEARDRMPARTRPRPVLVNTWEAAYFDLETEKLKALADRAAEVGAERFVLDDGWFGGRRDDTRGLGDWWVSPDVFPDGLAPLVDHVTGLGLEFGIWVEPEMANPDSDLLREHPDWALVADSGKPVLGRNQVVVDLVDPDAWAHLHGRLDALLSEHDVSYVKWDHNRELWGATHGGRAAVHRQTAALLRMLARLREDHPHVELESCASGGGRIDLGIIEHVHRFWTSDDNDALERQRIQRGMSYLVPPEAMGAHVGPPEAHTTGRAQRLAFRAGTALLGHLGIEWNLLSLDEAQLAEVAEVVALHKRLRPLLHGGDVHRLDHVDPTVVATSVVAPSGREAVVSIAVTDMGRFAAAGPVRLAGLDAAASYRVTRLHLPDQGPDGAKHQPAWLDGSLVASGRMLMAAGLQPPLLLPQQLVLLHLEAVA